jgi:polyhydroxyalkanoate synthesis regulator phasin
VTNVAELDRRVTKLEERVDDIQDLARQTGEEMAGWRTTLNNHTKLLNAIRDDVVDQGKVLADQGKKLARVEKEMHAGFARIDDNFTEVEKKFAVLYRGQDQITRLLTRALGEPDDGTTAGGAGD